MELNDLLDISPSVKDFDYDLPVEKIAIKPADERDGSKLLVYRDKKIVEARYREIDEFINPGALLVFNNTRVIQARLHFKTSSGATIELFCLEPEDAQTDIAMAMQATGTTRWKCLVGELRKWKEDELHLEIGKDREINLSVRLISRESDAFIVEFTWTPASSTFAEVLDLAGKIPLPPYIKRDLVEDDKEQYQTVYACHEGSVAAPTAGLHFTNEIFGKLEKKQIDVGYLTLHVGAGTFKPIKTDNVADHHMHSEQFTVERRFIEKLISKLDSGIVAVGTTSLRTLETLYWLGAKIYAGLFKESDEIGVKQWDPYTLNVPISAREALQAVATYLEDAKLNRMLTRTQILIIPGYQWKIVDALATNFHQPKSTLIMLVASFIGEDWKRVYHHALENNYRFLSYGDGSLLFRDCSTQ